MDLPLDGLDQEERIKRLREELSKLGCSTTILESMPADMEEISLLRLLENSGLEVPAPETLEDDALKIKLKETIDRMASLGAYLLHTNHVSDRDLYEYLYNDALREETVLFPENPSYAYMIDLTGSGSDEDNQTYLKYYADEEYRRQWAHDWPNDPIPEPAIAPYNRDSALPKSPI